MMWGSLHDYQQRIIFLSIRPTIPEARYYALNRGLPSERELTGKGLYGGRKPLFLPEGHTDFVFRSLRRNGDFSSAGSLELFVALICCRWKLWRGRRISRSAAGGGIICMLCFCVVVNIGMTAGMFHRGNSSARELRRSATIMTMVARPALNVKRRRLSFF
jgi:rod shape determining protein RodA